MIKKIIFSLILFVCYAFIVKAQQGNVLFDKIDSYHKTFPKEKIYLSLDKPYYNVGDTLWFKSFLLNGDLSGNTRTDKIYVELFNDSSQLVEKRAIALNNGLGYGDFALSKKLTEGTYTLRAYSNWQQNFGSDYFFQKNIYIGNVGTQTWLLDSYQKLNTANNDNKLDLKIRLTNLKNQPAGLLDLEVYLMNDKKRVMKADLRTTVDGSIETTIPLSDKIAGNYSFFIVDKKDRNRKAMLPIILQDVDEVDLQFMPEGGYLVDNIYSKVAFKAIGADGLGRKISGKIVNSKNEQIVAFKSQHKGMGNFFFLTQKGETYTALYTLNGKEQRKVLPPAKEEGTTLRIDQLSKPDTVLIYIKASEGSRLDQNYELVAQCTDQIVVMASISLKNGYSNLKLLKKDFPDGIIHFTLFSPAQKPINERSVFINRKKRINLNIVNSKNNYQKRDSISLDISATKEDGSPLSGTFSIAITDDGQVEQPQDEENIMSHFLLESEVKGNIEDAGWYFSNEEITTLTALDNLLLAQSWVGYEWDKILKPIEKPAFKAEKDNQIEGKVAGLLNKPMANIDMKLLSLGKSIFFADTLTNAEGRFIFKNIPLLDSPAYSIKIKNTKGKTAAGTITVDEFIPSKEKVSSTSIKPWYVNADSASLNYFRNVEKQKKPIDPTRLALEGNQLKEVEIIGNQRLQEFVQKTAWDAKFFKKIDEEELKKIPRKTLLDLLRERIDGFTIGDFYADGCFGTFPWGLDEASNKPFPPASRPRRHNASTYMIGQRPIAIVNIDKINTVLLAGFEEVYQGGGSSDFKNEFNVSISNIKPELMYPINTYVFNALSAEDIKDIMVYKGCNAFFLEITTRSGKGPWLAPSKGVYVYRPIPIYHAREFYSPKYTVDRNSRTPDLRSTIFWDANVVTDENGKAKISFYAADLLGSYTIKVEGTDLFGRFGYQKSSINIKDKTDSK